MAEAGWTHKKFAIYVWRSVRASGDKKTKKSRRSLALPKRAAEALRGLWNACPAALRHSFVSLLDDANVPIEKISRLVGHADTTTTETVYRFQIRPVIQDGATAMDEIFPDDDDDEPGLTE